MQDTEEVLDTWSNPGLYWGYGKIKKSVSISTNGFVRFIGSFI